MKKEKIFKKNILYSQNKIQVFFVCFLTIFFSGSVLGYALLGIAFADTLSNLSELKPNTRLSNYLFSKTEQNELQQIGRFWDKRLDLQQDCKEEGVVIGLTFMLLSSIDFPEDKPHPVTGAWQHRFSFERCGKNKVYNAIFIANKGKHPQVRPYYPGTTRASLQLIRDSMITAKIAAHLKNKLKDKGANCYEIDIIDTRLFKGPHDVLEDGKPIEGVWNEEWTLQGCGSSTTVNATFVPDGKGGTHSSFK